MKKIILSIATGLLSISALAEPKPEQCLLLRDDGSRHEMEVPQGIPIRSKGAWNVFETPKKVLPAKFRMVKLIAELGYAANIKLRKISSGEIISVSASAGAYVKSEKTQENTYYRADILPRIYIQINGMQIVSNGNKLADGTGSFELHVVPCSNNEIFIFHGPEAIVESSEQPENRDPPVLQ